MGSPEREHLLETRKQLINEYKLTQGDIDIVVQTIASPDPNAEIGIDPKYLPPLILSVLVTNEAKYVFLPPGYNYSGSEVEIVPGWNGWRWIKADLSEKEKEAYITKMKLGNGTAWDQGLQVKGEKSSPEWAAFVATLSSFAVDDPNYPQGKSPAKVIPSIIYPPPSLRAAFAKSHGVERGTCFEMLKMRRHEESHVTEMLFKAWSAEAEDVEGFPPGKGAATFFEMLDHYGFRSTNNDLLGIFLYIGTKNIMPRSYLGELQAYAGDAIFYAIKFGINTEEFNKWTSFDIESAKVMNTMNGNVRNHFGALFANEIIRQIGVEQCKLFLNELYQKMRVRT